MAMDEHKWLFLFLVSVCSVDMQSLSRDCIRSLHLWCLLCADPFVWEIKRMCMFVIGLHGSWHTHFCLQFWKMKTIRIYYFDSFLKSTLGQVRQSMEHFLYERKRKRVLNLVWITFWICEPLGLVNAALSVQILRWLLKPVWWCTFALLTNGMKCPQSSVKYGGRKVAQILVTVLVIHAEYKRKGEWSRE